jgi:cytochrome P450
MNMKLPDGPKTPQFIQLLQSIARPTESLEACARRYGDPYAFQYNEGSPIVVVSNPKAIQDIFTNPSHFDSGEGNEGLRFLLGDNSLILLDGERHQRQRQLLTPPFHGERMQAYGQIICDITKQVSNQWTIGKSFNIHSAMQEISLRVILSAVFGLHEGQRFEQLRQLLSSLLDSIGSPLGASLLFFPILRRDLGSWSPWGQFLRLKQQIEQFLYAEIQQFRNQSEPSRTDILALLMSARDEMGQMMTYEELRDELMTLLVVGHETTASALSWALYWIHHLPKVHNKLLLELGSVVAQADLSAITKLPYLNAVCQETLRIYPIAMTGFARIVKLPIQLMGYNFDPGTRLIPCIYLTHQREELYPQPKQFRPERFLERQFSPYEYLPFGGSNRRCIGIAFAQFEMKLVMATIVSCFQLALADNRPVRPVRRGLGLPPPKGMRMVVTNQR